MKHPKKGYCVGDKDIECLIAKFTDNASSPEVARLLNEIFTTVVKLGRESEDKGDLKLVNSLMKELRYSFKIFSPYRCVKKVALFGSARTKPSSPDYKMAEKFASLLSEKGYMVVTGGGSGIMEAGNKGAAPEGHFALNIRLPFEQKANPYVNTREKFINFKYFFARKLIFIKETDATALFPGGFGTNDEGFEVLTLVQTGKSKPRPIVLMEPPSSKYWAAWRRFVCEHMVKPGLIDKRDLSLFRLVNSAEEGVSYVENFYRVYNSIRYVSGLTVLRLNRDISDATLRLINRKFRDILIRGDIRRTDPLQHEVRWAENLHLPRLLMDFNHRDYGRLYELIHVINQD